MIFIIFATIVSIIPVCDAARYGVEKDRCLDGSTPERDKLGNILWCSSDLDCTKSRKCMHTGEHHFTTPINYCCSTKVALCSQPPSPGYGMCAKSSSVRYYFDAVHLRCKTFQHLDCNGGNENNFLTLEECERFCQSTACEAGESVLTDTFTGRPVTCGNQECPSEFRCSFDQIYRRHVCCGHIAQEKCPIGHVVFTDEISLGPKRCKQSQVSDPCAPDFFCVNSGQFGYCCSPSKGVCPIGQRAYEHPVTKKSLKCDPLRTPSVCPKGHSCYTTVPGANWGACCEDKISARCPHGTEAYFDRVFRQPIQCTVGTSYCAMGYRCQAVNSDDLIGFCCSILEDESTKRMGMFHQNTQLFTHNDFSSEHRIDHTNSIEETGRNEEKTRRIVDIQKEVDAEVGTTYSSTNNWMVRRRPVKTSTTQPVKYLQCPANRKPVFYPGTQLIYECSGATGSTFPCPGDSECVLAVEDLFSRFVCCEKSDVVETTTPYPTPPPSQRMPERITVPVEETEDEEIYPAFVYTVTLRAPPVESEHSTDPFCPRVIADRECVPGRKGDCPEYSFFCQYNIQYNQFRCCSMDGH